MERDVHCKKLSIVFSNEIAWRCIDFLCNYSSTFFLLNFITHAAFDLTNRIVSKNERHFEMFAF